MKRTLEQWSACLPSLMARQSEAAITYAFEDAKSDIAELAKTRKQLTVAELKECWAEGTDGEDAYIDVILVSFARAIELRHGISESKERKIMNINSELPPLPSGYAYEYPGPYGGIQFTHGEERNGSKPIRAVPYYFAAPPSPLAPVEQGDPTNPKDDSDRSYDRPIGYLSADSLSRLNSGHDATLRSAKFGPSYLDCDVPIYLDQKFPPSPLAELTDDQLIRIAVGIRELTWADVPMPDLCSSIRVIIAQARGESIPPQPPIDNDHVTPGCEQFGGEK